MTEKKGKNSFTGLEVAVIGMAGKFPEANNVDEFWDNVINGREGISFHSDQELEEAGISLELIKNPDYVKANTLVKNKEYFDSSFFGYNPREAEVMDPQVRLYHEVSWEALEDAGYDPMAYKGSIGIYAGSMSSFDWQALSVLSGKSNILGDFAKGLLHNSDLMCHRISHRLNLKGPSFTLFSACSTSLVAIHLACRALVTGECSMALAGGVTISHQQIGGYIYEEGMIRSPDGHCRTFDAKAEGTVMGEGIGVVVLKRAKEAFAARDNIYALVIGSAINNDGMNKVDFTAPGVKGEVSVIRAAQKLARVSPESISYIETHGTATNLGDPIEISALKKVFQTEKKGFCALGSVKTNFGHLDAAAGVTGLIKTAFALKHKVIPPTLHFENPNPKVDFENSPFYVHTELIPWKNDQYPLRAGVSAFGVGGTNAHVVMEEVTKDRQQETDDREQMTEGREYKLILLSAKTQNALDRMTENLAAHFKKNPGINLADGAYTLQTGRKAFRYRRMVVCANVNEAIAALSSPDSREVQTFFARTEDPPVVFMFSGQGSQYGNMALDFYRKESVFRSEMNRCFTILENLTGINFKKILYPDEAVKTPGHHSQKGNARLFHQEIIQPVLFALEYSLARLLMHWGIRPFAMIGYSIGEYVAACLSGVFSLEDALNIVALRGKLMMEVPEGAMMSVPLPEDELMTLLRLKENENISLAVVNGPSCIVSGPVEDVDALEKQLNKEKLLFCLRLSISHAGHSKMMESILPEFAEKLQQIQLNKPQIPYISNVTGDWIKERETTDPAYWVTHLKQTVRFDRGIKELIKETEALFMEIGPGRDLSTLVKRYVGNDSGQQVINMVRNSQQEQSDIYFLSNKIGNSWLFGKSIDWAAFYSEEKRRRISLPTYPFEGQYYWIERDSIRIGAGNRLIRKPDLADWFYVPLWQQILPVFAESSPEEKIGRLKWLLFVDELGVGTRLGNRLKQYTREIILVSAGDDFHKSDDGECQYSLNPGRAADYESLFKVLEKSGWVPQRIVHCWSITGNDRANPGLKTLAEIQELGIHSLLHIARAIGQQGITEKIELAAVSDNMQQVIGQEELCPEKATLLGAVKVIPLEYLNINCRSIDILLPHQGGSLVETLIDLLLEETMSDFSYPAVAIRGNYRWVQEFKPLRLDKPGEITRHLKERGVYLITGGLGGIGFTLAEYLARTVNARLILTGRSDFPSKTHWDQWLHDHDEDDAVSVKIRKARELEESGAKIMITKADVANFRQMQTVIDGAVDRFGPINGVIHAAGIVDYGGVILRRTQGMTEEAMAPQMNGTLVLDEILKDERLDFFVLCSSVGNIVYKDKFGQVGYAAANEFLEAFASSKASKNRTGTVTVAINWSDWLEVGMVVNSINKRHQGNKEKVEADIQAYAEFAISPAEGAEIFSRIMNQSYPRVSVSPQDLGIMIKRMNDQLHRQKEEGAMDLPETVEEAAPSETYYPRPELPTEYVAPTNEIEQTLAAIFRNFLGVQEVGTHDDFFELGGNSLTAINVINVIRKTLSVELPLIELFNRPTIESLGQYINSAEKQEFSPLQPVEKKDYYILSAAQRRLYIMQQMEEESTAYNQPNVVLLEGDIDRGKLETAVLQLIKRHEMLRTTFEMAGGEPVQKVHAPLQVGFTVDFYQCDEKETRELVEHFIKPFDLGRLPLFRIILVKQEERKHIHILMLDIHHIISDGVTNNIFISELTSFYMGKKLSPLKFEYRDFAEWQYHMANSNEIKKQKDYWLKVFTGDIPILQLPFDYERPAMQSFAGDILGFGISGEETEALNKIARDESATLFMVVLALYNIMLSKISGQKDIVVGAALAGRRHVDLELIFGMFVNTVALRNNVDNEQTFREFLAAFRENTLMALENQDYQFEDLVDEVVTRRDPGRNPIFDAILVFQNIDTPKVETDKQSPLRIRPYEYKPHAANFDLNLQAFAGGTRLNFTLEYRTSLFKKETIEWFIRYFKEIVAFVVANPGKKISEITTMDKKEKETILARFGEDLMDD